MSTLRVGNITATGGTGTITVPTGNQISQVDAPSGLVLIKSHTIGTGVSSVTVTDVFSSTYDNYRIIINNTQVSPSGNSFFIKINGSAGSTYNYSGDYQTYSTTRTNLGAANSPDGFWIGVSSGRTSSFIDISSPFLTSPTSCVSMTVGDTWTTHSRSYDSNSASSVSFTLIQGGTMTGGSIRVYGYRNS